MKFKKIVWAPSAENDLREAYEYIRQDSQTRAVGFVEDVLARVEKLVRFEKLGRMIPEIGYFRYREIIVGEYRIFHEVREKEIFVFRVLHSKRFMV